MDKLKINNLRNNNVKIINKNKKKKTKMTLLIDYQHSSTKKN
jgi:hypothetical protein